MESHFYTYAVNLHLLTAAGGSDTKTGGAGVFGDDTD